MSRKIIINSVVNFEPEKKRISNANGIYTISASAALCFELLIDNIGNLVTHDQFYEYAWRRFGMEPTSTSLYQNISTIRKSLSKAGIKQDIIRTMPRRGFILSPLTDINRNGPERIPDDNGNNQDRTGDNFDEKINLINETENFEMNQLQSILPLATESHVLKQGYAKMSRLLAILLGIAIGIFAYFMAVHTRKDTVFNSKPVYYKKCIIFSNRDNDIQEDKMFRLIGGLGLSCENNRYIYITNYRLSDRTSLVLCRNPLVGKEAPQCHSVYYIENMGK